MIPLLVLLALIGAVAIYQAGQRSGSSSPTTAAPSSSNSTSSTGAWMQMPNFVGVSTVQSAASQLRGRLGQQLSVEAPGGASSASYIVGSQSPPAGTLINASTRVQLWPQTTASSNSGASSSGSASSGTTTPAGTYTAGTYVVGSDIEAGSYRTDGPTSGRSCYWSRERDTSGDFDSIIANGNAQGPTTLTVRGSDGAVQFSGSCTWTRR